ncbi:MAG TPA: DUF882 domain-containing protein [Devosia sp.]|nr:DUF882 domain-containing protein [Devosia sp.]
MVLSGLVAFTLLLPPSVVPVSAAEGDRTLYLRHTHTGETGHFTYKRNGKFDTRVLKDLNVFLADWRTKDATKMDPALFDLLWAVYRDVRATQPINIVSSYRSPKTNAMLASRSSAVADNSQHMKGKALDFFIPGVNLTKLRETAMRHQVGGVGYYPTSGSPFVHLDTGSVRAWPRMTRAQLKKVFPDGRTLHIPTDGKVLSAEGRRYAEAQWKECRAVPCNGTMSIPEAAIADSDIVVASVPGKLVAPVPASRPARMAGDDSAATIQLASIGGDPTQRIVPAIDILAPVPVVRGSETLSAELAGGAPVPAQKSQKMLLATLTPSRGGSALDALAALGGDAAGVGANLVTAYAVEPDPEAQRALRMIIERETTASVPKVTTVVPNPQLSTTPVTASLGGSTPKLKGMFDLTFSALDTAAAPKTVAVAVAGLAQSRLDIASIETRDIELVAPELDHVNETLVMPVAMSGRHFAVLSEAEGYLDKQTELGPMTSRLGFLPESATGAAYDRFVEAAPLLIASN